ncbi:MAG: hypothetical protein ABI442_23015 [Gemmatimonadaceae bacterium]
MFWSPDGISKVAQAGAIVAGGMYFLYRLVSGFFITNLSIDLACERIPNREGDDYLQIIIRLKKGDRGTLVMHEAQVRVTPEKREPILLTIESAQRLSFRAQKLPTPKGYVEKVEIIWKRSERAPFLNLSPGEETVFSVYARVPRDILCTIEVVLVGRKPLYRATGQWRASAVVLPNKPAEKKEIVEP